MKFLFLTSFLLASASLLSQPFEWEPVELGPKEIKKRKITWSAMMTERGIREGKGEYFEYDKNGYTSLVADTSAFGGSFHRFVTVLDNKGRKVEELLSKDKVGRMQIENTTYDSLGRVSSKTTEMIGPYDAKTVVQYIYKDKLLSEERFILKGREYKRKSYYYAGARLDSVIEKTVKRRKEREEVIGRQLNYYHKNGELESEYHLSPTYDTMEYKTFSENGLLLYDYRISKESDFRRGYLIHESSEFKYEGDKLIMEIKRNDGYRSKDGGEWKQIVKFDKEGNALNRNGKAIRFDTLISEEKEWELKHLTMNGDTLGEIKSKSTDFGKEIRQSYKNPRAYAGRRFEEVTQFNLQNQKVKSYTEVITNEETCKTEFTYTLTRDTETKTCTRTGYKDGAEGIERTTQYHDPKGLTTKKTLEVKNFDEKDSLKLFEETKYFYDKKKRLDSSSYYRYGERKTQGNSYKFKYDKKGNKVLVNIYGQDGGTLPLAVESYRYHENGKLMEKTYQPDIESSRIISPNVRYYSNNGQLEKVVSFNQDKEIVQEIIIYYNEEGLCTKQEQKDKGYDSKWVYFQWGRD